jgi:hypothetical protein
MVSPRYITRWCPGKDVICTFAGDVEGLTYRTSQFGNTTATIGTHDRDNFDAVGITAFEKILEVACIQIRNNASKGR